MPEVRAGGVLRAEEAHTDAPDPYRDGPFGEWLHRCEADYGGGEGDSVSSLVQPDHYRLGENYREISNSFLVRASCGSVCPRLVDGWHRHLAYDDLVEILEQDAIRGVLEYDGRLPSYAPFAPAVHDLGVLPRCVFCGCFAATEREFRFGWHLARERWHEYYVGQREQPGWRLSGEIRPTWVGTYPNCTLNETGSFWRPVRECEWCGSWNPADERGTWYRGDINGLYAECVELAAELRAHHTRFVGHARRTDPDFLWDFWGDDGDTDYDGDGVSSTGNDANDPDLWDSSPLHGC